MATHTPGLWKVEEEAAARKNIRLIVTAPACVVCRVGDPDGLCVREDARLIAAAPDLLAACKAYIAVEHLKDPGAYLRGLDTLTEQMRAAIAKATE